MILDKQSAIRRIPIYITTIISCILFLSSCSSPSSSQLPSSQPAPITTVPTTKPAPAPSAPPTEIRAPTTTPTPPPAPAPVQPTPAINTTPAELKFISMAVTPIVAEPGKPITVEVKVANAGGMPGSTKLTLTANGVEAGIKDVTIQPRTDQTIAFTFTENASGIYEIKVAGFTDTLRVKQTGAYPHLVNNYIVWAGKTDSANYLWHPQQEPPPQLKTLASYDMIGIPYTIAYYAPESIQQLRKLNPRIKIVALLWVGESDTADLRTEQSLHESWFLHYGNTPGSSVPAEQRRIKFDQKLWLMNPASEWSTYVPNYIHDKIMSSGLFDGVFYDMVMEWGKLLGGIDFKDMNRTDINNDGIIDSPDVVKQQYNNGMTQILKLTRELCGQEAIIICGCGAAWGEDSPYWTYANGLFQENALGTSSWSNRDFSSIWNTYQINMQKSAPPSRINWIGADTNGIRFDDLKPNLPPAELQKMRYGLAITLLDDGYFHFDCSFPYHCQLWWFPEYDANLGLAKGKAQKRSDGTWIREFQNGVAMVNPTTSASMIKFATAYQDVSTGAKGTSFTVQPQDGRIFMAAH